MGAAGAKPRRAPPGPAADADRGAPNDESPAAGVRLQKVIADAGVASRRRAESLIAAGRVKVNGRTACLGARVAASQDVIEIDGVPLPTDRTKSYFMLNKPAGVLTTSRDPQGRKTVIDMIGVAERVFAVGRLDAATEGLLILTTDGELAHRLTHPSFGVPKTYVAEVSGRVGRATLRQLVEEGVTIDGGRPAGAQAARILSETGGRSPRTMIEVVVHEGRKHLVRKLLDGVGHPVRRLVRTGVGSLRLGRLAPGTYRKLTPTEVVSLYREAGSPQRRPPPEAGRQRGAPSASARSRGRRQAPSKSRGRPQAPSKSRGRPQAPSKSRGRRQARSSGGAGR